MKNEQLHKNLGNANKKELNFQSLTEKAKQIGKLKAIMEQVMNNCFVSKLKVYEKSIIRGKYYTRKVLYKKSIIEFPFFLHQIHTSNQFCCFSFSQNSDNRIK